MEIPRALSFGRVVAGHVLEPTEHLDVRAIDERGSGGANHHYRISGFDGSKNPSGQEVYQAGAVDGTPVDSTDLLFQNGPVGEVGVNGITNEALIAVVIDRLEGFQRGRFEELYGRNNICALMHLREALRELQVRTRDRIARGVEGTSKA